MTTLTQSELKEILHYDEFTGYLTWLKPPGRRIKAGQRAGCIDTNRDGKTYIRVRYKGKYYYAHRLAVLYVTGKFPRGEVDHISGNGTDNKWSNLRRVPRGENCRNRRLQPNNTSGFNGVDFLAACGKWRARAGVFHLGLFEKKEDAIAARKAANIRHGYHENHGTSRPL